MTHVLKPSDAANEQNSKLVSHKFEMINAFDVCSRDLWGKPVYTNPCRFGEFYKFMPDHVEPGTQSMFVEFSVKVVESLCELSPFTWTDSEAAWIDSLYVDILTLEENMNLFPLK